MPRDCADLGRSSEGVPEPNRAENTSAWGRVLRRSTHRDASSASGLATEEAQSVLCRASRWGARSGRVVRWNVLGFAGVLTLAQGTSACDRMPWDPPPVALSEEEAAVSVVVERVGRGPLEARIEASSTIEAELQVTVHAESTGRLIALAVEEGARVAAGARIARIRADVQAAGLDRARTQLEEAQRELKTVERLRGQGFASDDEHERAKLAYETALLDVRDRRRDVGNTVVTAPFAGTITERMVSEGAFVTTGQSLVTVTDFGTLVARVYLPEKELDRVAVGQAARVRGKAVGTRQGDGRVARIAPVVDPATGTFKVTVALPESDPGTAPTFLPGMYATLLLTTDRVEDALRVPKRALVRDDDAVYVFVTEDDRAKRVDIELGLEDGAWAEVKGGLAEGASVVVEGQSGLKDGAVIRRVDARGHAVAQVADGPGGGA